MGRRILTTLLAAALIASLIWAAVAPGMQALIPTFSAIASAITLIDLNSDLIRTGGRYYRDPDITARR